jgi:hypothetical protein
MHNAILSRGFPRRRGKKTRKTNFRLGATLAVAMRLTRDMSKRCAKAQASNFESVIDVMVRLSWMRKS